jgi:hypothetical protein
MAYDYLFLGAMESDLIFQSYTWGAAGGDEWRVHFASACASCFELVLQV